MPANALRGIRRGDTCSAVVPDRPARVLRKKRTCLLGSVRVRLERSEAFTEAPLMRRARHSV